MARKALASKNSPTSLRLYFFALSWLLMDRFQAPGWAWGAMCVLWVFVAGVVVYDVCTAEEVELK